MANVQLPSPFQKSSFPLQCFKAHVSEKFLVNLLLAVNNGSPEWISNGPRRTRFHCSSSAPTGAPDVVNPWGPNHFSESAKWTLPSELEWGRMGSTQTTAALLIKNGTCSGFSPGGIQAYSSRAQPESSSDVEFLWKSNMSLLTVFSISKGITVTMCSSWGHLQCRQIFLQAAKAEGEKTGKRSHFSTGCSHPPLVPKPWQLPFGKST